MPPFRYIAHRRETGQFRIAANLDAPSLVVGKMPVKDVVVLFGHAVKNPHHDMLSKKVPRLVEHQASPLIRAFRTRRKGRERKRYSYRKSPSMNS
jgi:hypothetical protein